MVRRKPRNGIWNMNRHHLSNIRWVNDINITPDTGIGSVPCVGVDCPHSAVSSLFACFFLVNKSQHTQLQTLLLLLLHCFPLQWLVLNFRQMLDGKYSQRESSCSLANSNPARPPAFAKNLTCWQMTNVFRCERQSGISLLKVLWKFSQSFLVYGGQKAKAKCTRPERPSI